ncbi:AEC family transporter [Swingsia samuiensis]|uniref:Permease n=1 Tax=Swingsia samuiensis TaxID=1293412 RepID=A0A4Y6UGA9_9PROT|nr:AEC family transporter [Swingsia samuiensis]QDH16589.1 permease [Swingsia samuiensis]
MFETIIAALLPIVVTLCLGFFAGWHHDFDAKQGSILNRMVMLYALPLALFASMLGIERSVLLAQGVMALILIAGMVGGYFLVLLTAYFVFRQKLNASALLALAIAGPAVPFVGVPVLGVLYGQTSSIPIALCSLIMNLFQVPMTLFLLSRDGTDDTKKVHIIDQLKNTMREPVVWVPILAFLLLILNIRIPVQIRSSFQLLGGATGGVALFASGIILYSFRVVLNRIIVISVIAKNILLPLSILVAGMLFGIERHILDISVITLSIPTASIGVIFSVQYKVLIQEMASILFFSTILSVITMGGFLFLLH